MGYSRQEYWSGLHFLLQEIFPTQESSPHLLHLLCWQACSLPLEPPGSSTDILEDAEPKSIAWTLEAAGMPWTRLCTSASSPDSYTQGEVRKGEGKEIFQTGKASLHNKKTIQATDTEDGPG